MIWWIQILIFVIILIIIFHFYHIFEKILKLHISIIIIFEYVPSFSYFWYHLGLSFTNRGKTHTYNLSYLKPESLVCKYQFLNKSHRNNNDFLWLFGLFSWHLEISKLNNFSIFKNSKDFIFIVHSQLSLIYWIFLSNC